MITYNKLNSEYNEILNTALRFMKKRKAFEKKARNITKKYSEKSW